MPEELPIAKLNPGDVITFESMADIPPFEDRVVSLIDQQMSELCLEHFSYVPLDIDVWAGRAAIKELFRLPEFHGPVSNLRFIKMADAYEKLTTATERGVSLHGRGGKSGISTEYAELTKPFYQGFQFIADARSANGWHGHIQAEAFYYPVPISAKKNRLQQTVSSYGGLNIYRRVSKPSKVDAIAYGEAHEHSKEIGHKVLAKAMRNARPTPMRN